jgi:hypothetical protein
MQKMGRTMGMDIAPLRNVTNMPPPTRNTTELRDFLKAMKGNVQLVVVVVPDRGDCYGRRPSA